MTTDRKRTKAEKTAYVEMMKRTHESEVELRNLMLRMKHIPSEWHEMEKRAPCVPKRVKVTLRVDEKTVKFFRAFGSGWHNRIDKVLQTYMYGVISKEIEMEAERDAFSHLL